MTLTSGERAVAAIAKAGWHRHLHREDSVRKILASVHELQTALKDNRAAHRDIFEKAVEGYRKKAIEALEARLAQIRNGSKIDLFIRMPEPTDHTNDYDRIIRMLDMHQEEKIEIDEQMFAQYVMDDWDWKTEFVNTSAMYLG